MYMDEGLDTGDILLKKEIRIRRRETAGTLHDRLAELAPAALNEALSLLKQGRAPRTPQDASQATYAPKLKREDGGIVWTATHEEIDRQVRAMNPWPGAFTLIPTAHGIRKLKVFSCIQHSRVHGQPAEVLRTDKHGILVGAGRGAVLLREVQPEGKRRMPAEEFLRGNPIPVGTWLGATQGSE